MVTRNAFQPLSPSMNSRFAARLLALLLVAVFVAGSAFAQVKVDPIGTYRTSDSLGNEYRDMGAGIAQIQTVKRIPFFNLDGKQRLDRFSTYGSSLKDRNFKAAASAVHQDFSSGLVKDLTTVFLTDVLTKVAKGQDLNTALSDSIKGMTSKEFLAGNLLGGTLGCILGTAVPVPALPGLAGQMMGNLPLLAGAMLGTRVGVNLINGRSAFAGINPLEFLCQAAGSSIGMVLGGLLPVPTLGPIVGGAIGGTMGVKFATWLQNKIHPPSVPQAPEVTGTASLVAAAPPTAAPQAPQTSTNLAGLQATDLRKLSDSLYRDHLRATASGDRAGAETTLRSYKQVQEALAAQR
ncbi:MAG: hypothetical protein HY814_03520 [Candidatus Riflebacteria bacterium]|nr:hypothetical protein [Candidatus Riflebacteria bacterium]